MRIADVTLWPEEAFNETLFPDILYERLGLRNDGSVWITPVRRSIDARSKRVCVRFQCEIYDRNEARPSVAFKSEYQDVRGKEPFIVVGSGPAGLFAALKFISLGHKPIVFERGSDVQARRRDLAAINKEHLVNPESNYCFGEGGAGTYSDGKLYTRSKKRGDIRKVLEAMVAHGAKQDILFDAHPHIGTNKLPKLVAELRQTILDAGGEIHFNTKVVDFLIDKDTAKGVVLSSGEIVRAEGVVLATGHSARDIFFLLGKRGIKIESKPFALGVRVEHSQNLIDRIQYHCAVDRGPYLPASSYGLVQQTIVKGRERGVFSFCMCPGGFIVSMPR